MSTPFPGITASSEKAPLLPSKKDAAIFDGLDDDGNGPGGTPPEKWDDAGPEKVPPPLFWGQYLGIILTLVSSFAFALNSLASQVIVGSYSVFLVAFVRAVGVFLPSAGFMLYARYVRNEPIFDPVFSSVRNTVAVVGRGICGAVVTIAVSGAIKFIGTGDTLVVKSCAPLLVAFFAACCLDEKIGFILIICGIQVILGVLCIAKPTFITGKQSYNVNSVYGTLLALSVAMAAALGIICIRYSRKLHFSIPTISMGIVSCIIAGGICAGSGGFALPGTGRDAVLFFVIAASTAVTQIFMVLALKYDSAGAISLVRTTEVFFGFFLQITFLGIIPDPMSAIGAMIVVLAVVIAVASKK